jgi:hypothetical protein
MSHELVPDIQLTLRRGISGLVRTVEFMLKLTNIILQASSSLDSVFFFDWHSLVRHKTSLYMVTCSRTKK